MVKNKKTYYIYITASVTRVLYIGITNNLYRRILQHKKSTITKSFTHKYKVNRLVYYEEFEYINEAIEREKQLKKWRREKKVNLIESANPGWHDLFYDFID